MAIISSNKECSRNMFTKQNKNLNVCICEWKSVHEIYIIFIKVKTGNYLMSNCNKKLSINDISTQWTNMHPLKIMFWSLLEEIRKSQYVKWKHEAIDISMNRV